MPVTSFHLIQAAFILLLFRFPFHHHCSGVIQGIWSIGFIEFASIHFNGVRGQVGFQIFSFV